MTQTEMIPMRNSDLVELAARLKTDQARKRDFVVPASQLRSEGGNLVLDGGAEPILTEDGVTTGDVVVRPSARMIGQAASRLGIPVKYLRTLHESAGAPDLLALFDENVNTWLSRDTRSFLLRTFEYADQTEHYGRAMLSDRFGIIDNLDVLMAVLEAIRSTGVNIEVQGCDLSDEKMRLRVYSPDVAAMAPELLKGYRTPFEGPDGGGHGQDGLRDADGNLPVVWAGFDVANSETGGGAFQITSRLLVKVCMNGLVQPAHRLREIHLGGKLEEGSIDWSQDTARHQLDLIKSKTVDAVRAFLDPAFVASSIAELEAQAGAPVDQPTKTIERVGSKLGWSEAEQDSILAMFIKGGQSTSGGVMQAVTAAAQLVSDPDRAAEIEEQGIEAMVLASA